MASEPKLKPCPFCGGGAILLDKGYDGWIAVCDKRCTVHGGKEAAIAAWNRREGGGVW